LFHQKLTATAEQVTVAERELDLLRQTTPNAGDGAPDPGHLLAAALESVRKAVRGLAELDVLFSSGQEPSAPTRACPACGKTIMAAATMCGFCWTRTAPVPSLTAQ
jgi:hypothetical protein